MGLHNNSFLVVLYMLGVLSLRKAFDCHESKTHSAFFDDSKKKEFRKILLCRYDIMNYQKFESENGTVTYDYVQVGEWASGNLTMHDDQIYWPGIGRNPPTVLESVCSKPCKKGSIKVSPNLRKLQHHY